MIPFSFSRRLYLLVGVFIKVSIHGVISGKTRDFYVFDCSIKWRCEDIDQILLHGHRLFFLCAFSSSEQLPTLACWSREKREEGAKQTPAFRLKRLRHHMQIKFVAL